ncbi:MAG: hypothetical protein K6C12_14565, partial [Oscillospiraceae bacterium]|nr:hypothetical protein [Oscillospiraceae bacterium]
FCHLEAPHSLELLLFYTSTCPKNFPWSCLLGISCSRLIKADTHIIFLRRVLFEKAQHTGDCRLTGRFAGSQNKPPAERQLQSTIFRGKNNEYK